MPIWVSQRRDGTLHNYLERKGGYFTADLGYVERLARPDGEHPWLGAAFKQHPRDVTYMKFNTCEEAKTWVAVTVRMQS
jgi:hypothetical protein